MGGSNIDLTTVVCPNVVLDVRDLTCARDYVNICNTPTIDISDRIARLLGIVTTTQFTPIEKAELHDVVLPGIGVNFFGVDISPTATPCGLFVEVAISIVGTLSAAITSVADTQTVLFNSGIPLAAGALYVFEFTIHSGDTVNFVYNATGGTIQVLRVQEADSIVI